MTLDEKIEEAEFFLDLIKKNDPNLSVVKHYFSAFLGAVESIPDYILAEASQSYDLGLSLEDKWFDRHFEEKAKEKNNENAKLFLKWWRQYHKVLYIKGAGQVIKKTRDLDMHKTKQKPIFNVLWWPLPPIPKQQLHKIPVEIIHGEKFTIEDAQDSMKLMKKPLLERENKDRENKSLPPALDIAFKITLQFEGLPNFGSLSQVCETWLEVMKHYVGIAREIMEESKTGTPKI